MIKNILNKIKNIKSEEIILNFMGLIFSLSLFFLILIFIAKILYSFYEYILNIIGKVPTIIIFSFLVTAVLFKGLNLFFTRVIKINFYDFKFLKEIVYFTTYKNNYINEKTIFLVIPVFLIIIFGIIYVL